MRNLSYLWIIRCAGKKYINLNLEYKQINEAPDDIIIPLVEVINESNLYHFYRELRNKYGEVWVDLPYYLAEESNFHKDNVDELKSKYVANPISFFKKHKSAIDVPVVSAPYSFNFDTERTTYNSLKADFNKIAVRIRVPVIDITRKMLSSFTNLTKAMRKEDVLLLDVFEFAGVESQVVSNIEKMNKIAQRNNIEVYILNAFETNKLNCHNYGPLLTAYFSVVGFGDFATDERFKATGGRGSPTKIIRYYEPSSFTLRFFKETVLGYDGAKRKLVASTSWRNTSLNHAHLPTCGVCVKVDNNIYNKGHKYWKNFKMIHYLCCIVNETVVQFSAVNTPEDLDPDGYDTIVKSGDSDNDGNYKTGLSF